MTRYVVDEVLDNYVSLENIDTKEMCNVLINDIGFKVTDGDILDYDGINYQLNEELKKDRTIIIREKLERLKNLNN